MGLSKSGISYLDYVWNPCGFGCSNGCPTCWARTLGKRVGKVIGCKDCENFRVHFHPERLGYLAELKKPAVIGVQFTGELFDKLRPDEEIYETIMAMERAPQHTYVLLTQQPYGMAVWDFRSFAQQAPSREEYCDEALNVWKGFTIRTQNDLESEKSRDFQQHVIGKKWISFEPMMEHLYIPHSELMNIKGVIIGCDKCKDVPFELDWVYSIVNQCKRANVPVYVKQLRLNGKLVHDPAKFPKDLQIRQLPWQLTTKGK